MFCCLKNVYSPISLRSDFSKPFFISFEPWFGTETSFFPFVQISWLPLACLKNHHPFFFANFMNSLHFMFYIL